MIYLYFHGLDVEFFTISIWLRLWLGLIVYFIACIYNIFDFELSLSPAYTVYCKYFITQFILVYN